MKVAIGCDHGGLELKEGIVSLLNSQGLEIIDMGTGDCCSEAGLPADGKPAAAGRPASVDYPDYGAKVAKAVSAGEVDRGILVCGTGIGMSIVANKFPGVRAALCHDAFTARMSRMHNDANILAIGGRVTGREVALDMVNIWLFTPFEGGRHQRRLDKISDIEKSSLSV